MKKILLALIILTALFAQCSLVSSVYADETYTVGDGKQHATIQDAIKAITNDLSGDLSGQGVQTVEVYAGGSHEGNGYFYDETVSVSGLSNANSNDYVVLKAMKPNQGKRDTGIIVRAPVGSETYVLIKAYTHLIGFGITLAGTHTTSGHIRGIRAAGSGVQVVGNVLYNIKAVNRQGTAIHHVGSYSNSVFRNNMIMDFGTDNFVSHSQSSGFYLRDGVSNTKFYNNTIVNSSNGTYMAYGITFRNLGTNNVLKNNYFGNNYRKSFYRYDGYVPEITYCISSDDTANDWDGAGNKINKAATNQFKNATLGSEDLHLKKGADCIDAGADLSGQGFTDDIDGHPRPYGNVWDVGADEEYVKGTVIRIH